MPVSEPDFVRILLREQPKLIAYIRMFVPSRHLAEDVFQEVSLAACKAREDLDSADSLPAWLRTTARNQAVMAIRRNARGGGMVFLDDHTIDLLENEWERVDREPATDEKLQLLALCISRLPDRARQLIEMKYRDNLTGEQIASRVNRKASSVFVALSRARQLLRRCVHERQADG